MGFAEGAPPKIVPPHPPIQKTRFCVHRTKIFPPRCFFALGKFFDRFFCPQPASPVISNDVFLILTGKKFVFFFLAATANKKR